MKKKFPPINNKEIKIKDLNGHFPQEDIQMANRYMKMCLDH